MVTLKPVEVVGIEGAVGGADIASSANTRQSPENTTKKAVVRVTSDKKRNTLMVGYCNNCRGLRHC